MSAAAAALAAALGLRAGGGATGGGSGPVPAPAASSSREPSLRRLSAPARWRIARDVLAVASGLRPLASFDGAYVPDPLALARCLGPALSPAPPPPLGRPPLALLVVDGVCCVCAPEALLRECASRLEALRRRQQADGEKSGGAAAAASVAADEDDGGRGDDDDDGDDDDTLPPLPPPLFVYLDGGAPRLAPRDVLARVCAQLGALQRVLTRAFESCGSGAGGDGSGGGGGGGGGEAGAVLPVIPLLLGGSDGGADGELPALPTLNGWLLGYPVVYVLAAAAAAGQGGEAEREAAGRQVAASLAAAAAASADDDGDGGDDGDEGGNGGGGLWLMRGELPCPALPAEPGTSATAPSPLWQLSVPVAAAGGRAAVGRTARAQEALLRARAAASAAAQLCWGPPCVAVVRLLPAPSGLAYVV